MKAFKKSAEGFSRIELLATVSMTSLLLSLGVNLQGVGSTRGQQAHCAHNLAQQALAVQLYAADNQGWLPPNLDNGGFPYGWVRGSVSNPLNGTNILYLTDANNAVLAPYLQYQAGVFKCPSDSSTVSIQNIAYPRLRSYSANHGVGTDPRKIHSSPTPVSGPWLDGNHGHELNQKWRTYGKLSDITDRSPADLWWIIDEDPDSISNANFASAMFEDPNQMQMIDWPAIYHQFGANLGFMDGHVSHRIWQDPRTYHGGRLTRRVLANNPDIQWLADRTSSLLP